VANFKVRARTVDLLGRQQIANIATAISELFKNAHDAYADNVEVDYYRDDDLFVLHDDGLGMTREDFEERWLTLGTDSKVGGKSGLTKPPKDPDKPTRPVLGEKGIGRLAVALIGPQVLILTRAKRDGKPADKITACFINWGLFELPGFDLSEIPIPVKDFPASQLPDANAVSSMVDEVREFMMSISDRVDEDFITRINRELDSFSPDPADISTYLAGPSLLDGGYGTHFYIQPADKLIADDIDNRPSDSQPTRLEKNLIGFTDTMTPTAPPPPILTRFRDHRDEGPGIELLGERAFFTPEEFDEVDHHIIGRFDEYGQFTGKVGVYQMEPEDYVLSWDGGDGRPTLCGPFDISVAVLPGAARDTLLPYDRWAQMARKLDRHGGIYIYKDRVRVQPYGGSETDFLGIERRRTLQASYYFFSYRRMMASVRLSTAQNANLREKAGREGFSENKAFRQFQQILNNLFLQTAADIFREGGERADQFLDKKTDLKRLYKLRQKQEQQSTERRKKFVSDLDKIMERLESREAQEKVQSTTEALRSRIDRVIESNSATEDKVRALIDLEGTGRREFAAIRKEFDLSKPRGVGLNKRTWNEWSEYQNLFGDLEASVLNPAIKEFEASITAVADKQKLDLDNAARLELSVREKIEDARESTRSLSKADSELATEVASKVRESVRDSTRRMSMVSEEILSELERLKAKAASGKDVSEARGALEERIDSSFAEENQKLSNLKDHLETTLRFWTEEGFDQADLTEAMEEEIEALRESRDNELQLAQVGLALNTVGHEFEKTVYALRSGLRRMNAWAQANPDLEQLYREMRNAFDHLDGYLKLFTPLDRRLYRSKIEVTGASIHDFLMGLFDQRFERHEIALIATDSFRKSSVVGFPSDFYPVFVNLVDNAIFWLQGARDRPREITLDVDGDDWLVRDNGPGVRPRDRQNIFELSFSRRPGGRGMGLYISKQVLAKIDYDLILDVDDNYQGAVFRISPMKGASEESV